MNYKLILNFLILNFFLGVSVFSQKIDENDVKKFQENFKCEGNTKALQNILTNNKDLKANALNRSLQGTTDHFFKYRVTVSGITDQKSSGRCWMFTSMNVLRPRVMEKYNLSDFDFSHNYLYFWDLLEKSNLFLENAIATAKLPFDDRLVSTYFSNPVNDGGVWNLFYNVAEKYGVVPADVMPETVHSDNTRQMINIINERLCAGGYNLRLSIENKKKNSEIQAEKQVILTDIYRVLALCLGNPPSQFTWRYKEKGGEIKELKNYTPLQFYKEIIPDNYSPQNFVMIMNDPTREYYKVYEIQNYRNSIEGINWLYVNLPNDDIKTAALQSIKNNEAMYASCDVGKQLNSEKGILELGMYDYETLFGINMKMDKKARILTRQSGSSHAMTLIGCDTDENDVPIKWEFENSWGASSGNNGYLTFSDNWFNEYMFRFVINKQYLSQKVIDCLQQKPIQLSVWDFMY